MTAPTPPSDAPPENGVTPVIVGSKDVTTASASAMDMLAIKAADIWESTEFVPSPCVSVCRMSLHSGWCEGCFRTREEIARWRDAGPEAQRQVWRLVLRRAGLNETPPGSPTGSGHAGV